MRQDITYKEILRFAFHYWARRPKSGIGAILLMMLAVLVDSFTPVYTGHIVDALVQGKAGDPAALHAALSALAVFLMLTVVFVLLRAASVYTWNWFAVRNLYDIVTESLQKVQRFSSDWHANTFAGGTVRKITRGMWSFDQFEDVMLFGLLPAASVLLCVTTVLTLRLPAVGLFVLFMGILYCLVSGFVAVRLLAPRFRESAEADTRVGATLADIMTGIPTVKSFGTEAREDTLFRNVADMWKSRSFTAWQLSQTVDLSRSLMRTLMVSGMISLTVWLWWQGKASAGDLTMVVSSFFLVAGYLRDIGQHISNLQKSVSEMEDVVLFWLREDEVRDAIGAKPFARAAEGARGEIVFDKVGFAYQGQKQPIYDDFSLRIAPGEKVALVGASGSGKSTFVKLVQRLYDVQSGGVSIDGQDISLVTQESLRNAIALVPQEPILFHRSLAANIAYGKPEATHDEIVAAARKAYAHGFIEKLPQGYDTMVGERGIKLSGGERQRVAIARAILADAPILILDEATSSLDSVSEHYIQKALEELTRGRTTITIAHRLATIQSVDRILVFDNGRIVEQGTHGELLRREQSPYRVLFEMQALDLMGEMG
jgi:ATP-binding cassette subfamily B protein